MCTLPGCGAILKYKSNYTKHMKKHQGIHPYHCPYCNKGLSATNRTKEHLMKKHTGLWGFHCNKCSEDFKTLNLLKMHLQQNSCS